MRPPRPILRLMLLASLALAEGCAAPPPPLLDISNHACATSPDLISAAPLTLSDPRRPDTVKRRIDDTAPCLETAQGKSLYAAFRLPDSAAPFMIGVRSIPIGQGLLVPRLLLLDGTGAVKREIGQDSLEFRADTLTALIRSHPDERYLVVASTPQAVGQEDARIVETTTATTVTFGRYASTVHSGLDTTHRYIFAHGGLVTVFAAAIPGNPRD
ncbi:MAG TPA: hypothetical protein VMA53_21065 [Stellaceae bacterium]|nr:hypothetical protein [Stellaceae bacterium]